MAVGVGVSVAVGVFDGVKVSVLVGVMEGVNVAVAVGLAVTVGVRVVVGVGVLLAVRVAVGGKGVGDGVQVGNMAIVGSGALGVGAWHATSPTATNPSNTMNFRIWPPLFSDVSDYSLIIY